MANMEQRTKKKRRVQRLRIYRKNRTRTYDSNYRAIVLDVLCMFRMFRLGCSKCFLLVTRTTIQLKCTVHKHLSRGKRPNQQKAKAKQHQRHTKRKEKPSNRFGERTSQNGKYKCPFHIQIYHVYGDVVMRTRICLVDRESLCDYVCACVHLMAYFLCIAFLLTSLSHLLGSSTECDHDHK